MSRSIELRTPFNYCLDRHDLRDPVAGRMSKVKLLDGPRIANGKADVARSTVTQPRIVVHPALTPAQQRLVGELITSMELPLDLRAAGPLFWAIWYGRLGPRLPVWQHSPEYQLAAENTKEYRQWLFMT